MLIRRGQDTLSWYGETWCQRNVTCVQHGSTRSSVMIKVLFQSLIINWHVSWWPHVRFRTPEQDSVFTTEQKKCFGWGMFKKDPNLCQQPSGYWFPRAVENSTWVSGMMAPSMWHHDPDSSSGGKIWCFDKFSSPTLKIVCSWLSWLQNTGAVSSKKKILFNMFYFDVLSKMRDTCQRLSD